MFQSRISSAARTASKNCMVDRSVAKLVERATTPDEVELVLLDLTLGAVDLGVAIPMFHQSFVHCKVVLTRGQMDRDLVAIIQGA